MSAAVDLIKALEAHSGKLDKERLIRESFERGDREFFAAACVCLDPTVSYGQKKVPLIDEPSDETGDLSFEDFVKLAERLRKRELTGHAARDAMLAAAERSNVDEWNYFYRRVILKDFKAGFEHSTVNKALDAIGTPEAKQYRVPVFSCQLAKSGDEHPKKLTGPKFLDVKLDGVRLLTVVDIESKTVSQFTRNGNENNNFPHLREQFEKLIPHLPVSVVFDGEVVGRTFQELMSQLNRSDAKTADHKVALFDIVPLADFKQGKSVITQRKRHDSLVGLLPLIQDLGLGSITILPKKEVDLSTPEGKKAMEDFRDEVLEAARAAGDECVFEGFMIKDPDAPYVCKKGTNWLKWKPWIAVDLTVLSLEQGKDNGKYSHTLGALVCEGLDEGRFIRTNVATGMSDEDRDFFWKNPDQIIGYIIEVHADALTQNENEVGTNNYSLRFPSFNGKRGLAPGDKI